MLDFAAFLSVIDEIARLRGRTRELFAPVRTAAGLSEIEMAVLNAVVGARSPPTVPRIGRSLGHPRQVIQRSVNALAARGLIEAAANPAHKRAALLLTTTAGLAVKADADALAADIAAPLLAAVAGDDLRAAAATLNRLRSALESAGVSSPNRDTA